MAELADALDLGSSAARLAGSTPVTRTRLIVNSNFSSKNLKRLVKKSFLCYYVCSKTSCIKYKRGTFNSVSECRL